MLYTYQEIKTVHLEITDSCNAACPMCARNINGGEDNPQMPNTELSINDIKKIFKPIFIKQLERIYMCGNYGDPIAAKDTLEVFEYFRQHNEKIMLSMHTNGSAKKSEWWTKLAKVLGRKGYVVFSIDGLEDTNHLYRQNTIWSKIMENAQAFINAGGRARWDYIVFAHNEHQVEQAELLAKEMGFERFQYKKSARFFSNVAGTTKEMHQASNRKGMQTALLQIPSSPKYRNAALDKMSEVAKDNTEKINFLPSRVKDIEGTLTKQYFSKDSSKKKPMEKEWDNVPIKCKVSEEKSLYISAEGIVQPCCWTAGQMYLWYYEPEGGQIWDYIKQVGKENLSAIHYDLESIVNGKYMQELIPNSWSKPSCADGKLAVCAKICGTKFDAFAEQFK
jgi:MoaA/NifB/PqqE/SkfB family radical SAM enzyme